MRYAFVASALVAAVSAQGVSQPVYPDGVNGPPPNSNFPRDAFILSTVKIDAPDDVSKVYDCTGISPKISLTGSALIDEAGSTGSIVANDQFQFDGPPQAGVKVSAGWYRNANGTLSLGNSGDAAIFYNCLSGSFSNIYRTSIGAQCTPVYLALQLCTAKTSCGVNFAPVEKMNTAPFQKPQGGNDDSIDAQGYYTSATCSGASSSTSATASSSSASSSSVTVSSSMTTVVASSATPSAATVTTTAVAASTPAMVPTQIQPMMTQAAAPAPAPASGSNATVASATPSTSAPVAFKSGNAAPAVIAGGKVGAVLAVVAGAFALA